MLPREMVFATQLSDIVREKSGCVSDSDTFVPFVREAASEMLREMLARDVTHQN